MVCVFLVRSLLLLFLNDFVIRFVDSLNLDDLPENSNRLSFFSVCCSRVLFSRSLSGFFQELNCAVTHDTNVNNSISIDPCNRPTKTLNFRKKNTKITRTLTATIDIPRILTYLHIRIEWLTAKAKYQQQTERKWNVSGETEPYNNCLPPNCVFCVWYALKWFIRLETDCCL